MNETRPNPKQYEEEPNIIEGIRSPSMSFFSSTGLKIFCFLNIILVHFHLYIGREEGPKE